MINDDDLAGDDLAGDLRAAATESANKPATPEGPDMGALARKWLAEVETAERDHADFYTKGGKIVDLYTRQSDEVKKDASARQFAMLWANVSVLQPSIYARTPEPVVQRRHSDRDPVARQLCEMTERCLVTTFDETGFDDVMKAVRDDYLLPGRGSAWVRYQPTIEQDKTGQDVLVDETVIADFVHWRDLVVPKSRVWKELPWLGRKVYMTRPELKARFGDEVAAKCSLDHRPDGVKEDAAPEDVCKAVVIEIWSKIDKKCIWVSPGCSEALDYSEPHLQLRDFFPAPKPALATTSTKSLIPTPDYVYYQDQAEEINVLTARIGALLEQLKLVGFYPSGPSSEGAEQIEIAMKPGTENVLVPVPNWAAFADKGGVAQIQWLPVEQVVKVVQACFLARKELVDDVYQITGISDIARGDTDPRETKGAQQLKSQWGSIRLRERQKELARFARDLTRIMGEVVADKFQPDTLSRMSNIQLPWQAELEQKYQQEMLAWQQEVTQIKLAAQAQMAQTGVAPGQGALGNQGGPQGQAPVGNPASPNQGNAGPGAAPPSGGAVAAGGPAPVPLQSGPPEMGGAPGPAQAGAGAPNGAPGSAPGSGSHLDQGGGPGAPQGGPQPPAAPPQPQLPPQPQPPDPSTVTFDAVLKLMRDDRMRSFRIDIETDSTIEADENEHKQRLIEFMGAVSTFMEKALPAGQQHPELIPFLGESMSTLVRGFRVGRQLESTIEEAMHSLGERAHKALNGPPQIPPADQIKIEIEKVKAQSVQVTAQAEAARADADKQIAGLKIQHATAQHEMGMRELEAKERLAMAEERRAQQKHDRDMQLAGMTHKLEVNRLFNQQLGDQQSVLEPPTDVTGGMPADGEAYDGQVGDDPEALSPEPVQTPVGTLRDIRQMLAAQHEAQVAAAQAQLQAHNDNAARHAEALAMLAQHLAPRPKSARKHADGTWEIN